MTSSLESGFWERPRLGHSKELIICTAFKTCHKVPAWKTGLWVGKMEVNMDERWVLSEEEGNMSLLGDNLQQKEDLSWALRRTIELLWAAFQCKSCPHLGCHWFKMPLSGSGDGDGQDNGGAHTLSSLYQEHIILWDTGNRGLYNWMRQGEERGGGGRV